MDEQKEKSFSVIYTEDGTVSFKSESMTDEEILDELVSLGEEITEKRKMGKFLNEIARIVADASYNGTSQALIDISLKKMSLENSGLTLGKKGDK